MAKKQRSTRGLGRSGQIGVPALVFSLSVLAFGGPPERPVSQSAPRFEVTGAGIPDLQAAMTSGRTTARELVQSYLDRIRAYDPWLNSMICLNPNALSEAARLDAERAAKGPRGPLHGIPIVLKDNYATADLPTTAGSVALADLRPPEDAFQVSKLRAAGCIIIGKTNLHELACGITTISSLGGQTRNPYDPSRNPGGSSGGTGAAVAASLAAAGMGSDTCGSIRIPAGDNCLVGLRPTHGLSSLNGIVPLSHTQDVGGPLARTAMDLAIMLDATVGEDPEDPATSPAGGRPAIRFVDSLQADALRGARLGALTALFGDAPEDEEMGRIVRSGLQEMEKLGAVVVEVKIPDLVQLLEKSSVIDFEFKFDLADYLSRVPGAPVGSLSEILDKGLYHSMLERTFRRRNAPASRDTQEYREAMARRQEVRSAVLKVMDAEKLDALVYPTMRRKPAFIGEIQRGSNCQLSATTGFPALSVPAGFTEDGLPAGIELLGRPWGDARLLSLGYAYEQATHHRQAPPRTPALVDGHAPLPVKWQVTADGRRVAPPVSTRASATARLAFDVVKQTLEYSVDISDIRPAEILFAGIHQAAEGQNGPVVYLLSHRSLTRLAGTLELSAPHRRELVDGRLYLSIVTRTHPQGELRAQLKPPLPAR